MDSGNSGSLQSSSGGDDEFDSRCGGGEDSSPLSALLRQPPAPSSVLPGFGDSFYGIQDLATPPMSHWSSTTPLPAGTTASISPSFPSASAGQVEAPAPAGPAPPAAAPPRGSRKRTRASRRAPTTVLTTDTSNFRAMVQEFTGIPAPPFAGGVSSTRSRFDHLFPSRSGGSPAAALAPYLLRPFAQKLQQASLCTPFVATPSSSPAPPANKAVATSTTVPSTTVGTSGNSYRFAAPPSAVLGMQDHGGVGYLSFQRTIGAQLDSNASRYPAAHPMFDAAAQRLPDPAGFSGLAHGVMNSDGRTHLHPRHSSLGHGGDELAGLVGATSVSSADDSCKTTTYSTGAGSAAFRAAPLLERNAQSTTPVAAGAATATTAAMRAQVVESSWICTSE